MIIAGWVSFEYAGVASGKSLYFWQVATGEVVFGDSWLVFGGGAINGVDAQVFFGGSSVIYAGNGSFFGEMGCRKRGNRVASGKVL